MEYLSKLRDKAVEWWKGSSKGQKAAVVAAVVILFLVLFGRGAEAQPQEQYPMLVEPKEGQWFIRTANPRITLVCEKEADENKVHACQAWLPISPQAAIPVSGWVYCYVEKTSPAIDGTGKLHQQRHWSCVATTKRKPRWAQKRYPPTGDLWLRTSSPFESVCNKGQRKCHLSRNS